MEGTSSIKSDIKKPRLLVTVGGLEMTQEPFELRVFANKPESDEDVSRESQNFEGKLLTRTEHLFSDIVQQRSNK